MFTIDQGLTIISAFVVVSILSIYTYSVDLKCGISKKKVDFLKNGETRRFYF